jgi:hypothetical protein
MFEMKTLPSEINLYSIFNRIRFVSFVNIHSTPSSHYTVHLASMTNTSSSYCLVLPIVFSSCQSNEVYRSNLS